MLHERRQLNWQEAKEVVHASTVFTTHTPVPAGNDVFTPELMRSYFAAYPARSGIDHRGPPAPRSSGPERQERGASA